MRKKAVKYISIYLILGMLYFILMMKVKPYAPFPCNGSIPFIGLVYVILTSYILYKYLFYQLNQLQFTKNQLEMNEEKLRIMIEAGSDGIWEYNLIQDELLFSNKWKDVLECKEEEVPGNIEELLKVIHPEDVDLVKKIFDDSVQQKISKHDIKFRVETRNKTYKWIVCRGQSHIDQYGNVLGIVGTFTDITTKIELQKELIESEKKYRRLIEFFPDPVLVFKDEKIVFMNSNVKEIIGTDSLSYIAEKSIFNFIHPDFHEIILQRRKLISENHSVNLPVLEAKLIKPDQSVIDIEITSAAFNENESSSIISVIRDITARKEMEMELKRSNQQLEETIDKLKETQAQLIQQEKLAGIGQLAAGIAHEINNPLGFILSNFDTLEKYFAKYKEVMDFYRETKDLYLKNEINDISLRINEAVEMERKNKIQYINEDLEELFHDTNEGIERVSEIIKGLRVFSRVDKLDDFEEYNINDGIKNTLIVARNEIKYFAQVNQDLKNVPSIQAMGGAVNQVILNILVNAVYAIKEKELGELGLITIRTYCDDHNIYCEIEDNGIGIDEKDKNSIFDPFFTTKPEGKGTGLGLSIAYDIIVNKHNGNIRFTSTKGIGTKFTLRLPINNLPNHNERVF